MNTHNLQLDDLLNFSGTAIKDSLPAPMLRVGQGRNSNCPIRSVYLKTFFSRVSLRLGLPSALDKFEKILTIIEDPGVCQIIHTGTDTIPSRQPAPTQPKRHAMQRYQPNSPTVGLRGSIFSGVCLPPQTAHSPPDGVPCLPRQALQTDTKTRDGGSGCFRRHQDH